MINSRLVNSGLVSSRLVPSILAGGAWDANEYADRVLATRPIAYWPLDDAQLLAQELVAQRNGTHVAVTLGQPGIGDGKPSSGYNGTSSYTNIYSVGLAAVFNGLELSVMVWGKVNAGVWTDNTYRALVRLLVDGSSWLSIFKYTDNRIYATYLAGGVVSQVGITVTPSGFYSIALTVSKSADALKLYYNAIQQGVTQTGLGTWSGSLASTSCVIGADDVTPSSVWSGNIAHVALWNRALTPDGVAALSRI